MKIEQDPIQRLVSARLLMMLLVMQGVTLAALAFVIAEFLRPGCHI